jgi:hypothetical protein
MANRIEYVGYAASPGESVGLRKEDIGLSGDDKVVLCSMRNIWQNHRPLEWLESEIPKLGSDKVLLLALPSNKQHWPPLIEFAGRLRRRMSVVLTPHSVRDLLPLATVVLSMAGYNSLVEIIAARIPAIVFPDTERNPDFEQAIHAERLAKLGFFSVVPLYSKGELAVQLSEPSLPPLRAQLDLGGAERAAQRILQETSQ